MEFTKQECIDSSASLKDVSSALSRIFTEEFGEVIKRARENYESAEADELYNIYQELVTKFPDFKKSVDDAATYLDQVASDYDAVRNSVENAING